MSATVPKPPSITRTHRVMHVWLECAGIQSAAEVRVHLSRYCENCTHDGLQDAEWMRDGGVEKFGRCMNSCAAADAAKAEHQWCDLHQSQIEWAAHVHRPERPTLALVAGSVV